VKKQYRKIKEFLCNSPKDWQVKIHASVNSKEVVFPIWSCKLWQRIRSKFSSGDRGSIWARLEPHVIGILHRKSTMVPPADVACYLSQTIRGSGHTIKAPRGSNRAGLGSKKVNFYNIDASRLRLFRGRCLWFGNLARFGGDFDGPEEFDEDDVVETK